MASVSLVDKANLVSAMGDAIDTLADISPRDTPALYIDLEGVNLGREGSISLLQMFISPLSATYLVDVHALGADCFSVAGNSGRTFQDVLGAEDITKVSFDVRSDSDALHAHFGIRLASIHDLQLIELATKESSRTYLIGLAKCINYDADLGLEEVIEFNNGKQTGIKLFASQYGGSYEVFNQRPLSEEIVRYCVQDVMLLPRLWASYNEHLDDVWWERVLETSKARVEFSQSPEYVGKGQHMKLAPKGWPVLGCWIGW